MDHPEENAENKRENILTILKKYGFPLKSKEPGEDGEIREIYAKGREQFVLGKDVTFVLGDWKIAMPYEAADKIFTPDADKIFIPDDFPHSDTEDQTLLTTPPGYAEHYVNKPLGSYFDKVKKSANNLSKKYLLEISDFLYRLAA